MLSATTGSAPIAYLEIKEVLVDALSEGLGTFSLPFQVALSALGAGLGAAILVASLFYLKNYKIPAAAPEDVPETEGSGKE